MDSYPLGNEMTISVTFADATTKVPTNPTNVACLVLDPCGNETSVVPTNPTTGVFQALYTPLVAGIWHYRWVGTGIVTAAVEGAFEVQPSAFQ